MIFLYYIFAILSGIIAGTFTGLMPGIHINLVAASLLILSPYLLQYFSPIILVVFIVSMSIAHCFLDFIPSIFLSAPDSETALSIMPGHKLLLKGKGYAAVRLSLTGCYIGIFVLLLSTPLFIWVMPFLYSYIQRGMAFILIASVLFLLLKEKNKFWAFFLFLLSGILGIATLNLPIKEPLFPLLTGLFGTSMILTSIEQKTKLPNQDFKILNLNKKEYFKISFAGLLASSLCSFLPGLGASQAAVMASDIRGKTDHKSFLVLIGIISTLVTGLNFVAIYAISKPRSGVAVIASKILEVFDLKSVIILLAVMLVSATFSLIIGLYFAKIFASCLSRLDYSKISMAILVFLIGFTVYLSGLLGFGVLIVSTAIGVTAISRGIRKMHLMGCLMLPVILYFLNIL